MRGLSSPWGARASICAHFGWTYKYLLWGISWVNVQMFLADLPSFDYDGESKDTVQKFDSEEDLRNYYKSIS